MAKQKNNPPIHSQATYSETREMLLEQLGRTVAQLYECYQSMANAETEIYEGWTARDILGHITFWHESFARNVRALAEGSKPSPLKGSYAELNQRSIDEMRPLTTRQIMKRLQAAHRIIQEHILSEKVGMIPYRKGSRDYSPEEHLDIVNGHIMEHLKGMEKARRATSYTSETE